MHILNNAMISSATKFICKCQEMQTTDVDLIIFKKCMLIIYMLLSAAKKKNYLQTYSKLQAFVPEFLSQILEY